MRHFFLILLLASTACADDMSPLAECYASRYHLRDEIADLERKLKDKPPYEELAQCKDYLEFYQAQVKVQRCKYAWLLLQTGRKDESFDLLYGDCKLTEK